MTCRLSDGTTAYSSGTWENVARQVDGDFDFASPEVDEEALEQVYSHGQWFHYKDREDEGAYALRRSILEGRRPYLVFNVRNRVHGDHVGIETGDFKFTLSRECPPFEDGFHEDLCVTLDAHRRSSGTVDARRLPEWFAARVRSAVSESHARMYLKAGQLDGDIAEHRIARIAHEDAGEAILLRVYGGPDSFSYFLRSYGFNRDALDPIPADGPALLNQPSADFKEVVGAALYHSYQAGILQVGRMSVLALTYNKRYGFHVRKWELWDSALVRSLTGIIEKRVPHEYEAVALLVSREPLRKSWSPSLDAQVRESL